jgi:hypothetical protein
LLTLTFGQFDEVSGEIGLSKDLVFAQGWWQKGAARMAEDHPTVNCEVVERSRKSLASGPSDWMV